jgi:SpoIIAA-like
MIELIPGLPSGVVGLEAKGKVSGEDYEQVVIPAVEQARRAHERIRLLYVLGSRFDGFSAAAMWDDARVGMRHPFSWERVAMVTDHEAYRLVSKGWGFLIPGHLRVFELSELDAAKAWVSEGA